MELGGKHDGIKKEIVCEMSRWGKNYLIDWKLACLQLTEDIMNLGALLFDLQPERAVINDIATTFEKR